MKCVRVRTGQVVAVWAPPRLGTKKKGKMEFLDGNTREEFGAVWELVCVLSMSGIIEAKNR